MKLNWGILGAGWIAGDMAEVLYKSGRPAYSIANRTKANAEKLAKQYGIQKVYDDPGDIFKDENVDAIYIATPHNRHFEAIIQALKNGKHVLCEKSITLNITQLREAAELAEKNGLVLAEAMTVYHMPLYKELALRLKRGEFGRVNFINVFHGSFKEYDMSNRFFSKALAGGAILDLGVYALAFVRQFLNSSPDIVKSAAVLAPSGVDEQESIVLMNKDMQTASITLSLHSKSPKYGIVSCEKAYIEISDYQHPSDAKITYSDSGRSEIISAGEHDKALLYEIQDLEASVSGTDCTYLNYSTDVMEIMSRLRDEWGVIYPEEE